MERREFPIRTYVTLTWQLLLFSLVVTLVLDHYIEGRVAWVLPVIVLVLSIPYIVRVAEIIADVSRAQCEKRTLRLKDISKEYAVVIHGHRGMLHWTLIFEDEADNGQLFSLTAAATQADALAMWKDGGLYRVEWLKQSRVITAMESIVG